MSEFKYYPLIRTRDSELRCFKNLKSKQLNRLLPIYELTRSRKSKIAPDGDIARRMAEIKEIQQGRPFILDLTTDEKYSNFQIEQLLSPADGFREWQYFLFDIYSDLNIIPMIHLIEDDHSGFQDVLGFIEQSKNKASHFALRLPYDLDAEIVEVYLTEIASKLGEAKLYFILDVGQIPKNFNECFADISDKLLSICEVADRYSFYIEDIILLSTSFPNNVVKLGKSDVKGHFEVYEEVLYEKIREFFPDIRYGDYVSINTEQIEMKGVVFVPRIDVVSEDGKSFIYVRYRRNDGGYIRCAQEVLRTVKQYKELDTWANTEILNAAGGKPGGASPSYWISIRMNYYIETKLRIRRNTTEM